MAEGRNENDVLKKIGTKRECPLATRTREMGTVKDFGFMLRRFGCRAPYETRKGLATRTTLHFYISPTAVPVELVFVVKCTVD